jgi:hypothetical protein
MHAFQLIDGNHDFIHCIQIVASSPLQPKPFAAIAAISALLVKPEDFARSFRSAKTVMENQEEI